VVLPKELGHVAAVGEDLTVLNVDDRGNLVAHDDAPIGCRLRSSAGFLRGSDRNPIGRCSKPAKPTQEGLCV